RSARTSRRKNAGSRRDTSSTIGSPRSARSRRSRRSSRRATARPSASPPASRSSSRRRAPLHRKITRPGMSSQGVTAAERPPRAEVVDKIDKEAVKRAFLDKLFYMQGKFPKLATLTDYY